MNYDEGSAFPSPGEEHSAVNPERVATVRRLQDLRVTAEEVMVAYWRPMLEERQRGRDTP